MYKLYKTDVYACNPNNKPFLLYNVWIKVVKLKFHFQSN